MKTNIIFYLFCLTIILAGCQSSKSSALHKLESENIEFNDQVFFEKIVQGDAENVKLFIDAGIDDSVLNNKEISALMVACIENRLEVVKVLIENGADVNLQVSEEDFYSKN